MFGKIGRRWFAWLSVMIWNTVYQGTRFSRLSLGGDFWSTGLGSCLIEDASSFIRDAAPFSSGVALTGNTSVVVRRVVLPCQQIGLMDFYLNSPLGVVPLTVPSCDSWGSPELLFQLGLSRLSPGGGSVSGWWNFLSCLDFCLVCIPADFLVNVNTSSKQLLSIFDRFKVLLPRSRHVWKLSGLTEKRKFSFPFFIYMHNKSIKVYKK